ncbi:hypothetical protein JCM11251_004019 [Rhodosporidiobolus azoricus]
MLGFSIAAALAAGASTAFAAPLVKVGPSVIQSYTTSAGSTFEYQSCNSDLAYGNRALPNQLGTTSKTVEACLDACAAKGYKLCGVEYHGECWGGNTLHETSKTEDESACNFTCWDNPNEICGGSGISTNAAMNLYAVNKDSLTNVVDKGPFVLANRTTSAGTYESQGCYSDLASGKRALPTMLVTTTKTVEACLDLCAQNNYTHCGVEYHGECWGGNALHETSVSVKASACDFTCWDNANQVCGGSGAGTNTNAAMNLYTLDAATSPAPEEPTPEEPIPEEPIPEEPIPEEPIPEEPIPVTPVEETPTGPFVLQNYTASTNFKYEYDACYSDLASGKRALSNQLVTTSKTAEACLELCALKNYKYCGVEYHGECWGGNTLDASSTKQGEKACDFTCWDNSNQVCGGSGGSTGAAMNLYTADKESASTATPTGPFVLQNRTTSAGVYKYDACYSDLANGVRALSTQLVTVTKSAEACLDLCAKSNYTLCGVEYHGECWGSNSLDKSSTKQKESACDLTCWDNSNQVCGGSSGETGAAMNLYRLNVTVPCPGFLVAGECKESCGAGFFQNNKDKTCTKCTAAGAATCTTAADVASSCSTGYLKNGACVESCGTGFYQDAEVKTCTQCSTEGAESCQNGAGTVSSCSSGRFLKAGQCVTSCGDGFFQDASAKTCTACTVAGAATCTTAANVASSCSTGYLKNGACVESCGTGFYQDAEVKTCTQCSVEGAESCQNGAGTVSSCSSGRFLKAGQCVTSCGNGFFQDVSAKTCTACRVEGATTCTTSPTVASSCVDGTYLDLKNGRCVFSCGAGRFQDNTAMTCTACTVEGAATCTTAANVASSCSTGFLKFGKCETSCGAGFFQNTANKTCTACTDPNAASCTTAANVASSCVSGYLKAGKCEPSCGTGFFQNIANKTCDIVPTCASDSYLDTTVNTCKTCSSKFRDAATCTMSAPLTCTSGHVLNAAKTQCLNTPSCNAISYYDTATNGCKTCDSKFRGAQKCTADAVSECNPAGFKLYGTVCGPKNDCPAGVWFFGSPWPGQYAKDYGTYKACADCNDALAKTCDSQGRTTSWL